MNTLERRLSTLEQSAGATSEHRCIVVMFDDETDKVVGLDPLSGNSAPPIDRLLGEEWQAFKDRASASVAHMPLAVFVARTGEA
jgi:hypothetical protein